MGRAPIQHFRCWRNSRSNTCVVLSSEWEFSPFIYPIALDELPEFVFIGIPASECHNPLIIPLAGHELGHVVWRRKGAGSEFAPKIKDRILELYRDNWPDFQSAFNTKVAATDIESDLFLIRAWKETYDLAMRQLEEMFCDFMGIFIFGESFFLISVPYLAQLRIQAICRVS
jgi:hypothetical protein